MGQKNMEKRRRKERVAIRMPYRKMPVDERLMVGDCEFLLELRTEQSNLSRLRREDIRNQCQGIKAYLKRDTA